MNTLAHDIRFGLRVLRKNPGFTLTAILALTLGIASTTAIFTVVDGVLLRPLPYPSALRISATDVSTFVLLSIFLGVIAFLACWWPAHRATRVDPMIALRAE